MKDKFRTNFRIALPAALVTLALILVFSLRSEIGTVEIPEYHLLQTLPYLLVLIGGVAGINVFVVLLTGIFSGAVIMLATGATHPTELLGNMGSGASGMFETIMVTILVSAMCGLIREYGGFEALLGFIKRIFHGQRGGQLGIGLLVGGGGGSDGHTGSGGDLGCGHVGGEVHALGNGDGRNQCDDGGEGFDQHGAVADHADLVLLLQGLRGQAGAHCAVEAGKGTAGDGDE